MDRMDIDGLPPLDSLSPLPPPSCSPETLPMDTPDPESSPSTGATGQFPPTPAEERRLIMEKDQASVALHDGRSYCLLDRKWHVEWLQWVGDYSVTSPKHGPMDMKLDASSPFGSPSKMGRERSWTKDRPGPLDNTQLLDGGEVSKLKRDINEREHYEIVSEDVWALLHSWYGGGPAVKRRAILQPSGAVVVELYGITLQIFKSSDATAKPVPLTESKMTTVESLKKRACEEFSLQAEKVRIFDYFNKRKYANLEDSLTKSLDNCRIYDNNDILLEEQNADGTWPPDDKPSYSTSSGTGYWNSTPTTSEDVPTSGTPPVQGAAGLQNLGNTCFMNSSLQCLSAVPELKDYFVTDAYKADLNAGAWKTNGKLAEAYSSLLKHIWNPSTVQVAPRNFKWQIGQFAEQFAGYGQQDSMEFIEYVLQGLMEDVNKVQGQKPFVELKEAEGRSDEVVAQEAEDGYSQRNNSKIDDLFTGFFKSTVSCPESDCGRVSIKFDPYCSIKLSLVSSIEDRSTKFEVSVVLLTSPRDPIIKHSVSVLKSGNAGDLIEAVAKKAGLGAEYWFLGEIYQKKFYKIFTEEDAVEHIGANDILILYQLPKVEAGRDMCELVIHARQERSAYGSYSRPDLLGIPLISMVDRNVSGRDLIAAVRGEFSRRLGLDTSFDSKWKLCRTADKSNVCSSREEGVNEDDESIDLGSRHYVIADFTEGLEIPQELTNMFSEPPCFYRGSNGASRASPIELVQCFRMLREEEKLSPEDTWYCSKCKEHREAFKKLEIWTFPAILVLQLKRFTYTSYSRDRLDTPVVFPLEGLDLSDFVLGPNKEKAVYDLMAVSKHMGGLGGGHYVAYGRSSENGKWYYYNDSSVNEATPEEVANDQVGAYVLFYMRRDRRPIAWA